MNLFESQHLSPENAVQARKSLVAVASCTLVFTSLKIGGTNIDVFGFSFDFVKKEIIQILRLLTLFLMIMFVLRVLPSVFREFFQWSYDREDLKLSNELSDLYEDAYGQPNGAPRSHQDYIESQKQENEFHLRQLARKIKWADRIIRFVPNLLIEFILPISLGTVAVYRPAWLREVLLPLAESLPSLS